MLPQWDCARNCAQLCPLGLRFHLLMRI
jgi:hypothetical protein